MKSKSLLDDGKVSKKEKLILETRLRYEQANQDYKDKLQGRLEEKDNLKMKKKEVIERDLVKKYNFLTMMREDNFEKTQRFEKMKDYLKLKKMEKINERMHRIDTLQ
jgi:hypothetical protein